MRIFFIIFGQKFHTNQEIAWKYAKTISNNSFLIKQEFEKGRKFFQYYLCSEKAQKLLEIIEKAQKL